MHRYRKSALGVVTQPCLEIYTKNPLAGVLANIKNGNECVSKIVIILTLLLTHGLKKYDHKAWFLNRNRPKTA